MTNPAALSDHARALTVSLSPLLFMSVTCKVQAQSKVWEEIEETQGCLGLVGVLLSLEIKHQAIPEHTPLASVRILFTLYKGLAFTRKVWASSRKAELGRWDLCLAPAVLQHLCEHCFCAADS